MTSCILVDASKQPVDSILRADFSAVKTEAAGTSETLVPMCKITFFYLKMEAAGSSEILVPIYRNTFFHPQVCGGRFLRNTGIYENTRRHIPENRNLNKDRTENFTHNIKV
jgi:hypothetical protein